jgi:hypothetical protein
MDIPRFRDRSSGKDEDMDSHAQSMDIPRLGTVDSGKDEDVDRDEG